MRVDFVGHATLLLRMGGLSLLTDPWWSGPAYRGQWYPYPLPVPERYDLSTLDAVYISHAHEDHLHPGTLRELLKIAPDVEAIIPLRYDTQMRDYLRRLGVKRSRELLSGTSCVLRKGDQSARLTIMTNMDDSLLVVEDQTTGEVLVNANDALHASRRDVITEYCRILRARFPAIDYLFCGFGGASYFPNCIHVPGKDDAAVARAREKFFLDNFALVARLLRPRMAFPFAAHFILPDDRTWWISRSRLQMEPPAETVRRLVPEVPTYDLHPGDYVENGRLHTSSDTDYVAPESARVAVLRRYSPNQEREPLNDVAFATLLEDIRHAVARPGAENLHAIIRLWDYPARAIEIEIQNGSACVSAIDPHSIEAADAEVVVETRSDLVNSTIRSPFGRDLISIGYGAQVHLRSREEMARAPHERLLNVLAPAQPRWRQRLRKTPLRTLGFVVGDPGMRLDLFSRLGQRVRGEEVDEPA
ncbi:MAG: MBL fold metallo-hydrolase, partial [Chloroflexi bacterium]|nr:MBL fold metallo-hydrolase [Chloroflexota bacterium]